MPRLTNINDILFPVREYPLFVHMHDKADVEPIDVPRKKAIVNMDTNKVLGVVSLGYRLVTNHQALEWARRCCQAAFPETSPEEWKVEATDAPGTGGHCFIDLVHESKAFDFSPLPARDRPDLYGPFIRVINSYNGLRALSFEIGFMRKVCVNGMILPKSIISFKFNHLEREIGIKFDFETATDQFRTLKQSFLEFLRSIRDYEIPRAQFEPIFCSGLLIRKPRIKNPTGSYAASWHELNEIITATCSRHAAEIGENAYAVFNAMTDFASRPPENRCHRRDRHSLQRLAGEWMSDFSVACHRRGFDLDEYVKSLNKRDEDENAAENKGASRKWKAT